MVNKFHPHSCVFFDKSLEVLFSAVRQAFRFLGAGKEEYVWVL